MSGPLMKSQQDGVRLPLKPPFYLFSDPFFSAKYYEVTGYVPLYLIPSKQTKHYM